jgi:hypothetical protein
VTAADARSRPRRVALRLLVDVVAPLGLYYALRAGGVGVYLALLASTVLSAAISVGSLVRDRKLNGLSTYLTTMLLASVVVSVIAGSPRFLLAKEAWLTALTGVWFLVSLRAGRPLAYLYSRPLLEGRLRWPGGWDELWDRFPRWRRMWRVSSLLWGIGTLADAALRVVMAYTLPIDSVPALGTALYAATAVVLIVVNNVYYVVVRLRAKQW